MEFRFHALNPAASANIKKLVEAGILTKVTGRKRDQLFVARDPSRCRRRLNGLLNRRGPWPKANP